LHLYYRSTLCFVDQKTADEELSSLRTQIKPKVAKLHELEGTGKIPSNHSNKKLTLIKKWSKIGIFCEPGPYTLFDAPKFFIKG